MFAEVRCVVLEDQRIFALLLHQEADSFAAQQAIKHIAQYLDYANLVTLACSCLPSRDIFVSEALTDL